MTDRLTFSEAAELSTREVEAMAGCLVRVLGPAFRGYPALTELVARSWTPQATLRVERERCLDMCAELLEGASQARRRGRDLDAYALEGVEARLLDALVGCGAA